MKRVNKQTNRQVQIGKEANRQASTYRQIKKRPDRNEQTAEET